MGGDNAASNYSLVQLLYVKQSKQP
jgi:hypothetical protein